MIEFAANQLLIIGNIEDFNSSTMFLDIIIVILAKFHQFVLVVVEVDLDDSVFILVDYDLNFGDLLIWVKFVIAIGFIHCSCFAKLAIVESESKCCNEASPLYLSDG